MRTSLGVSTAARRADSRPGGVSWPGSARAPRPRLRRGRAAIVPTSARRTRRRSVVTSFEGVVPPPPRGTRTSSTASPSPSKTSSPRAPSARRRTAPASSARAAASRPRRLAPERSFYIGGAYEFSKQDPNKLYRLGILQQPRAEVRRYFPTGRETSPSSSSAPAARGYGNEWTVDTWGPTATLGGGARGRARRAVSPAVGRRYRPHLLSRPGYDSSRLTTTPGLAHFVGARDRHSRRRIAVGDRRVSRRSRLDSCPRRRCPIARVICITCGRDNPAHLSFCQECGQRLAPRVAPPTPPQGRAARLVDGTRTARAARRERRSARRSAASVDSRRLRRQQRPPAPDIHFARRAEPPAPNERVARARSAAAETSGACASA